MSSFETTPNKCPKCGQQTMIRVKHGYSWTKERCMNPQCIKPYPVGRVLGLYGGWAESVNYKRGLAVYPAASEKDKAFIIAKIQELLAVGMGFITVEIRPGKPGDVFEGNLILAKHVNPTVNAAFLHGRLTRNTFVFENRYGAVRIETGKAGDGEVDQRSSYRAIQQAIKNHDAAVRGIPREQAGYHFPKEVYPSGHYDDKRYHFATPDYEALTAKREAEDIRNLKNSIIHDVNEYEDRINDRNRDIARYQEEINKLRDMYRKKFGEEIPDKKIEANRQ